MVQKAETLNVLDTKKVNRQLSILFLSILLLGGISAFIHPNLPAIAVIFYAIIGFPIQRKLISWDRFADSLYYMGFLYTLWAMFISIGPFSVLPKQSLIENIGMALLTTLLGLGLRIIILQFRPTVSDIDDDQKKVIERGIQKLQNELNEAHSLLQKVNEKMQKNVTDFTNNISNDLQAAGEALTESVKGVSKKFEEIRIPADTLKSKIDNVIDNIALSINNTADSVSTVGNTLDTTASRISEGLNDAKSVVEEIRSNAKTVRLSNKEAEQLKKELMDETKNITSKLKEVHTASDALNSNVNQFTNDILNTSKDVQTIREAALDAVKMLKDSLQ